MFNKFNIPQNNRRQLSHIFIAVIILLFNSLLTPVTLKAASNTHIHASNQVTLYYFWSRYCPLCKEAKPLINQLVKTYPWLTVYSYDLVDSRINQKRYLQMAGQLQQAASSVPAFIFCGQMMVGYDRAETTGQELQQKLLACYQHKNTSEKQENFNIPGLGNIHY